jgi:predicted dehydrogenase
MSLQRTESGQPAYQSAAASDFSRRDFLKGSVVAGAVVGGGVGAFCFGYGKAVGSPVRVAVLGTGDEGSVLMGAINPQYLQVKAIADIRPYNVWRAFHGDSFGEVAMQVRPGLMAKYGWKSEDAARRQVKVYDRYDDLIANAKADGIEAVIIALPLHLHAPAAVAAMRAGLHVITEKLMGHSVHECKEMARVSQQTGLYLAVGHQRHYNILYENATDTIKRGTLGDLHYIRAQWHRGNMPGNDSWQQPMPEKAKPTDKQAKKLEKELKEWLKALAEARSAKEIALWTKKVAQKKAQIADEILGQKGKDGKILAETHGYQALQIKDTAGNVVYDRPAVEELIRWRLWDRTGAGLMAELGSHQLDAASIFIAAAHGGKKQHPLSVAAVGNRPLFPSDRDVEDHVFCLFEFPAPGYDPKDSINRQKKIGVQYASINGTGFGGYGEIVYGSRGTLILEREQEMSIVKGPASPSTVRAGGGGGPTLDTQASGAPAAASRSSGPAATGPVSRGYTEELEHWAWCIRNKSPENQPRCNAKVAMGDAVIALTANMATRQGQRIEFKEEWFDPECDETPENEKPDPSRYDV